MRVVGFVKFVEGIYAQCNIGIVDSWCFFDSKIARGLHRLSYRVIDAVGEESPEQLGVTRSHINKVVDGLEQCRA